MQGELNTNTEPKTPQEITEFAKEVDNICVDWTIIWFPSFSNDKDVSELRKDEIDRFNALRTSLLNRMIDEFTLYNKK